jgi:CheY-like chemotaxis protein
MHPIDSWDTGTAAVNKNTELAGYIAAAFFGAAIGGDMIYGVVMHRESLLTWMSLLMAGLALFALFSHRITEFALSKDGITIRQKIEAASLITAAETARPSADANHKTAAAVAKEVADIVSSAVADNTAKGLANAMVLWVDDRPSNNDREREALEALGIQFTISTSTDDALTKLRDKKFDAIISNMKRPPDSKAGYTLLDAIKSKGPCPPFIIYAGSNAPEHRAQTKKLGGWGTTNRPQELFQLVLSALRSQGKV